MFDDDGGWKSCLDSYVLKATAGSGWIRCRIISETFRDCLGELGCTISDFPQMFRRHRAAFESAFRRMIDANALTQYTEEHTGTRRLEGILTPENFKEFTRSSG